MSAVVSNKEKKSFSKKLFRRSSVRSVGSFMNRVLRTLSTLSHVGTDGQAAEDEKDDATSLPTTTGGSLPSDDSDCGGFPFGDKVPGVAGLKNHGNTCFMNAILQCLSNTELFAEYLALEQFRVGEPTDKAKSNGVLVQKKGVQQQQQQEAGEVTEQLSGLVRALWTFEYTPQHSRDFKVGCPLELSVQRTATTQRETFRAIYLTQAKSQIVFLELNKLRYEVRSPVLPCIH